jgi:hypothetical protein
MRGTSISPRLLRFFNDPTKYSLVRIATLHDASDEPAAREHMAGASSRAEESG